MRCFLGLLFCLCIAIGYCQKLTVQVAAVEGLKCWKCSFGVEEECEGGSCGDNCRRSGSELGEKTSCVRARGGCGTEVIYREVDKNKGLYNITLITRQCDDVINWQRTGCHEAFNDPVKVYWCVTYCLTDFCNDAEIPPGYSQYDRTLFKVQSPFQFGLKYGQVDYLPGIKP